MSYDIWHNLDRAILVRYAEGYNMVYAWHGGHTVNVYRTDGKPVDVFSIGNFETGEVSRAVVNAVIDERIDNLPKL